MRVGLTTAAVLALVVVISAFLLVRGYNQNLPPTATSSVANAGQSWPIYEPIKIEFNKPMDHKSVEENLQILPPGERDRIPMSWDHNTLILGSSASQSVPLLPDTKYNIVVLAGARDNYGHALADTFSVTFRTGSIVESARDVTPQSSTTAMPSVTSVPTQQSANLPPPTQSNATNSTSTTGVSTAQPTESAATATATSTPTPSPMPTKTPVTPTSQSNVASTPTPTPDVEPTQSSATPVGTPTATPPTEATPSTAATPTQEPDATPPSATPVGSATPATGTPTADVIPVTGAFGSVYWANDDVQTKLGPPQAAEAQVNAAELGFQRGTMYERFDTSEIYVLFADGQWKKYPDTWTADEGDGGGEAPEDHLWIPKGSFGKIWNSDPDLKSSIGYAVNPDANVMGGVVQQFANGIMLYSNQGFVYVVYDDGGWTLYPDTSGHGDLITPTPSAGETPAGTPVETPAPEVTTPVTPEPAAP